MLERGVRLACSLSSDLFRQPRLQVIVSFVHECRGPQSNQPYNIQQGSRAVLRTFDDLAKLLCEECDLGLHIDDRNRLQRVTLRES